MYSIAFFAALAATVMASPTPASSSAAASASTTAVAYYNPLLNGGSMLDDAAPPLGEPLNVIISALSDPRVLTDSGFMNYINSLGLAQECLGLHLGGPQSANLGDGNGWVNQTVEMRYDYGNPSLGTCLETLAGGNHLRLFRQNGTEANSGALFLAVSVEENLTTGHTIAPNGYDLGRDNLAKAANGTAGTSFGGYQFQTTSENVPGMLPIGTAGVNHNISIDGMVTILTVQITGTTSKDTNDTW